jgi:hypothetical protein
MGMSENLADLALRPSYEQIVQSIKHQGVLDEFVEDWVLNLTKDIG